ncbi:MAG TPA: TIGR04255 family protein [Nocardioides sp.]|nr:TIGR04255 family protein [Nocardioides sp.]
MTNPSPAAVFTDVPLGGLPSADTTLLKNAPLEVAIIEVRFTSALAAVPVDLAARAREALTTALEVDFPIIQPATQGTMQVNFNAGGASWSGDETKGWQVASGDGQHSATVFPGSLIWQVGDYRRWSESMRAPLEVLLGAITKDLAPSLVQRIGLRYVDRFVDPTCTTLSDWFGKIDDTLLGPLGNSVFGSMVHQAQQQFEVTLDGRHGALLRHGPIHDQSSKSVNYLLDIDVFAHAAAVFNAADVVDGAERLNRTALSLFQACVSAEYLKSLQGEEEH